MHQIGTSIRKYEFCEPIFCNLVAFILKLSKFAIQLHIPVMKSKQADIIGMASAVLCMVHCLLVPLLLIVGVISGSFEGIWEYLDWAFIALAWTAVYSSTRHENNQRISRLLWATLVVFTATLLLHDYWVLALYLSVLSSLILASLHFLHFRKKHLSSSVAV